MKQKISGTDEAWDSGDLGRSAEHAKAAPAGLEAAIDASLGLQSISIRLPKQLIDVYRLMAAHHGIGYQPLMRDILQRFVPHGMQEVMEHHQLKATEATVSMEQAGIPAHQERTPPEFKKAA